MATDLINHFEPSFAKKSLQALSSFMYSPPREKIRAGYELITNNDEISSAISEIAAQTQRDIDGFSSTASSSETTMRHVAKKNQ